MKSSIAANILLKNLFFLLLGDSVADGQNVTSSMSVKNKPITAQNASSVGLLKCLQLDDDDHIQKSLISSKNYYNIYRALYPSVDIPSLYVKITVQFNSSTANGSFTLGKLKKYTWSKSCLYVATQFVSLCAMNVYSLGAIWPNKRRETELSITLPEFCNATEKERNNKMIFFLSTLEDLAIVPKVQDPRLNTVECIVEGHDGFDVKIFSGFRKLLMYACWCVFLVSAVVGFAISNIVTSWLDKFESAEQNTEDKKAPEDPGIDNNERPTMANLNRSASMERLLQLLEKEAANKAKIEQEKKKEKYNDLKCKITSFKFLICLLAVVEQALVVAAVMLSQFCAGPKVVVYPAVYLGVLHLVLLPLFLYAAEKGCELGPQSVLIWLSFFVLPVIVVLVFAFNKILEDDAIKRMRNTMIHFTFQMTIHHLLWILLGLMTDALWAIPVLVITCAVWYCILLLAHYFVKANFESLKERAAAVLLAVALVLSVILGLLVLGVVAQSFVGTNH